jgi:hypothetical protein
LAGGTCKRAARAKKKPATGPAFSFARGDYFFVVSAAGGLIGAVPGVAAGVAAELAAPAAGVALVDASAAGAVVVADGLAGAVDAVSAGFGASTFDSVLAGAGASFLEQPAAKAVATRARSRDAFIVLILYRVFCGMCSARVAAVLRRS